VTAPGPRPQASPPDLGGGGWHWGAAAAATFCIIVWGAVPLVTKVAAQEMDGLLVGILRVVFCLPVVAVMLAGRRRPMPRGWPVWRALVVVGLSSFIGFPVLFSLGQSMTTASHGGLILASAPILTGIVAALWHRKLPGLAWIIGACLGFAGVAALILIRAGGLPTDARPSLLGDLIVLAGVLSVAVGYVSGAQLSKTLGPAAVTFWANLAASLLILPWALWWLAGIDLAAVSMGTWTGIVYLAAFAQVINFVLWYWAMEKGGIARIAAFQFVQPVITLILAVIFLGEVMTLPLIASAALILAGVGLCQFKR
jgi:drug/metabolite transporter (DMT)-like permease